MPIFRTPSKLAYFSHIPKCGGTSVEDYLAQLPEVSVSFLDRQFLGHPAAAIWTKSSPQHVDGQSVQRLFPPKFFDLCFAIVRHPVDRFVSAFRFQQHAFKTVDLTVSISEFLDTLTQQDVEEIGRRDNHFLAQHKFLMTDRPTTLLRFEDGFDAVRSWLDHTFDLEPGERVFPRENASGAFVSPGFRESQLSSRDLARIKELYVRDFEQFGYT